MKIILPGDYSQLTKQPCIELEPRYLLTESPGRWLLYIFIFQALMFYSMPTLLGMMTLETVSSLKDLCVSLLNIRDKYIPNIQALEAEIIISGFIFWLCFIPEIIAMYYMLSRSGRDLAFPTILNTEKPIIKKLLFEEIFIDRRTYIGKTKKIGLTRRLIGTFFSILIGSLSFSLILFNAENLFILKGTNLEYFVDHQFWNFMLVMFSFSLFTNFMIIPARDFQIVIWRKFQGGAV